MFELSREHQAFACRRHKTLAQFDTYDPIERGGRAPLKYENPIEEYKCRLLDYIDNVPNTVDCVIWDPEWPSGEEYTQYPSKLRPRFTRGFYGLGEDMYQIYAQAGRERGLESILCHRITGSDPFYKEFPPQHKLSHPEMYINDWWSLGLHNLAEPELCRRKVEYLRESMENYDFDGLQIDFCRHTPFLPVGRQWELREHVTDFLRDLRSMLLELETVKGHPMMLYARVPHTVEGANMDGLDVETWALERIVDGLTLGSRSYDVDIEAFRRKTHGLVRLFPCFDYHHCTDGYANAPLPVARGVFANWWTQGADGIVLFNWMGARLDVYRQTGKPPFRLNPNTEEQQLSEVADIKRLQSAERTFVAERRGGYPWENGFANNNMDKQLPIDLSGTCEVSIRTSSASDRAMLCLIFSGCAKDIGVELNGVTLSGTQQTGYKDKLIRDPAPVSGFQAGDFDDIPDQKLTRCEYMNVYCVSGWNYITVHGSGMRLEKAEITIFEEG